MSARDAVYFNALAAFLARSLRFVAERSSRPSPDGSTFFRLHEANGEREYRQRRRQHRVRRGALLRARGGRGVRRRASSEPYPQPVVVAVAGPQPAPLSVAP